MIWEETTLLDLEKVVYDTCLACGEYPALHIEDMHTFEIVGPYCKKHWHENIDYQFDLLDRKLANEDWGSSPETRGEFCEMCCKFISGVRDIVYFGKKISMCEKCYEETKF